MGEIIKVAKKEEAIEFLEELLEGLRQEGSVVAEFNKNALELLGTRIDGSKHWSGVIILKLEMRYRIVDET